MREREFLAGISVEIAFDERTERRETDARGSVPVPVPESGAVEVRVLGRAGGPSPDPSTPTARIEADPELRPKELDFPEAAQIGATLSLRGEFPRARFSGQELPVARTTTRSGEILSSVRFPGDLAQGPGTLDLEGPDGQSRPHPLFIYDIIGGRLDQRSLLSGTVTQGEYLVCVGSTDTKKIRARIFAVGPVRFRGKGGKGKLFEESFPVEPNGLLRIPFGIQAEKTEISAGIPFRLSLRLNRD